MKRRPLLAGAAAVTAVVLTATAGTAGAASTSATGKATSGLSVLTLSAGGHTFHLVDLALQSDTTSSPHISRVVVTPVTADGTPYGRQVVDQSSAPVGVPAVSTPGALAAVAALTSPPIDVAATSGPSNHAGATSLGSVQVLGMPVSLAGALEIATSVSRTDGAAGGKTITVKNLALPSIRDLLAALGLDLSKLPRTTLSQLVSQLHLVTGAISAAQSAVDSAQAAVTAATNDLASKTAALTAANTALATAQATLAAATSALNTLITTNLGLLSPLGITDLASLLAAAPGVLATAEGLVPGLATALSDLTSAQTVATAAQAAVVAAQALVNAAQAVLATATNTLDTVVTTLVNLIVGKLDATPLVSLGSLEISTRAAVTSASRGGQHAEVVGGTISGLKVLGTDVLSTITGSTSVDLGAIVGSLATDVNNTVAGLTGKLSSILSSVPGLPLLKVPTPSVKLLTSSTGTSIANGFGIATTTVTGLSISMPGITLPSSVAVPGAAGLPGLGGVTQVAGRLTSAPLSVKVLSLSDTASFRPALAGASTNGGTPGSTGGLPRTGLNVGVALLAVTLLGSAFAVRRRFLTEA